jgi:hypothetical protein
MVSAALLLQSSITYIAIASNRIEFGFSSYVFRYGAVILEEIELCAHTLCSPDSLRVASSFNHSPTA